MPGCHCHAVLAHGAAFAAWRRPIGSTLTRYTKSLPESNTKKVEQRKLKTLELEPSPRRSILWLQSMIYLKFLCLQALGGRRRHFHSLHSLAPQGCLRTLARFVSPMPRTFLHPTSYCGKLAKTAAAVVAGEYSAPRRSERSVLNGAGPHLAPEIRTALKARQDLCYRLQRR